MSSPSAKSPKSPDHKRLRNGAPGSGQAHGPEHMDISTPVENGPPTMSAAAAAAGPVDSWVQSLPGTGKDRSRTDPARRDGGRRTGVAQPLTNEDLTKAFLIHEEQLNLLQHQLSLVYKIPCEHGLAKHLLDAVKGWQSGLKHLRPGEGHPDGSCSVAVATVLLFELTKGQPPPHADLGDYKRLLQVVNGLIDSNAHKGRLANEITHCSARLNKLKSHVILDFRLALYSGLMKHASLLAAILDTYDAERLGKRAPGGLSRKARGRA